MAVEDEIKPSGDDENGNMRNWSISKMISFLQSRFLLKDFAIVERVLSEREEKSKLEIKRLEANSYRLEEERLEKLGLADEIKRTKKELEELRSEASKLRAENIVLKERDKSAKEKCKKFSDENIELRKKICKLECAKAEAEAELERKRLIFEDLKNSVLKIESGFTILTDQDDTKNNKENGHSPNPPVDSPVKANGHSLKAGITGLQSQNIVEIVDSDDDCVPVENPSEKGMTPPTENSHLAQISVENGSRVLKRKETTSVEGENGDNDALSEKLKTRKLREPFRNRYDCALNHCSTTSIHSDIDEVNREHPAESERMPEPQVGFNLDGLPYSMELSDSSESSESSDSDSDYVDGVLKHLNRSTETENVMLRDTIVASHPESKSTPILSQSHIQTIQETQNSQADDRGLTRPFLPPTTDQKIEAKFIRGGLVGRDVPKFFRMNIMRCNIKFWPSYSHIDRDVLQSLWNTFKATFTILHATEAQARDWFEEDCKKKWRDFLNKAKTKALQQAPDRSIDNLASVPRQPWCSSEEVWNEYTIHWMSDQQRKYSRINSNNRRSSVGRPEGTIAKHFFGCKSVRTIMYEEEKITGVEPSPLRIIQDIIKKHDNATQEETCEYTDPKLQASVLYKERYGATSDPFSTPLVTDLWTSIDEVRASLAKGRVLRVGSSSRAFQMMVDDPPSRS